MVILFLVSAAQALFVNPANGNDFPSGFTTAQHAVPHEDNTLPNIVLIVADDLGYGDFSCYGAVNISTPHVDGLAAGGVRFTDAYVASSLCSPSRYSILTGRYSWRTKLRTGVLKPFAPPLIEEGRTTLASLLKSQGYATACIGKWHLGFHWTLKENAPADAAISVFDSWGTSPQQYIDFSQPLEGGPVDLGFDYFFGMAGSNNMIPFVFIENDAVVMPPSVPNDFGAQILKAPSWDVRTLDATLADKAVNVIDDHFRKKNPAPLFLYLATSAVHAPCLPTKTLGMSKAGLRGDMVVEFDRTVGRVLQALEANDALEKTIVMVTSDNGPQPGDRYAQIQKFKSGFFGDSYDFYQSYFDGYSPEYPGLGGQAQGWLTYDHQAAGPLSGFKSDAWEGGLRVPLIIQWPGKIKNGSVSDQLVSTVDLLATFADIASAELHDRGGEDSYSFLDHLLNSNIPPDRESLVMVAGRSGALAVRRGDWKFIEAAPAKEDSSGYPPPPNEIPGIDSPYRAQLYNLCKDIAEQHNLVANMPEKVNMMQALIETVKRTAKSEAKYK